MKTLAALTLTACVVGTGALAQDCTPAHDVTTVEKGFLTIAAPTFPPFSIPEGPNAVSGVDADVAKAIAAAECLDIKVAQVEYATAIPYVISGRADMAIGTYYRTAERAKVVALSAPIYLDQMGIFSKEGYNTVTELEGRKVGTVQGYLWVDELKKVLGDNLSLYNNYVAMYQDLEAGRIEIGVDGFGVGTTAQRNGALKGIEIKVAEPDERVGASVEPPQIGLPMTFDNVVLLEASDAVIAELHASGRMKEILVTYGLDPSAADVGEPRLVK